MSQVRGKYITMAGRMMSLYKKQRDEADSLLFKETGKRYNELGPEDWYDTKWVKLFLDKYMEGSISGINALVTFGKQIYPSIKAVLPPHLKTPLDYLKFETEGYTGAHKGPDVKPRKIIKAVDGEFIVEAFVPDWHYPKMYEGIFLGILEMCGVRSGKVIITEKGGGFTEFKIVW